MEGAECAKKPLYCHWDSHEQDVSFMNENELDQHIYSHFTRFPDNTSQLQSSMNPPEKSPEEVRIKNEQDEKLQQTVECHWDACHELFDIDEIMEHFRTSHMDVSLHPHGETCMRETKQCGAEQPFNSSFSYGPENSHGKIAYSHGYAAPELPPNVYDNSFHSQNQISAIEQMSPTSVCSSHVSHESDYSTSDARTLSGVTARTDSTSSGESNDRIYYIQPNSCTAHQRDFKPNGSFLTASDDVTSQSHSLNTCAVYPTPQDGLEKNQQAAAIAQLSHPSDANIKPLKIDIASLPTLQSAGGESSHCDETPQYPNQTCMWLTPDGVCGQQFFTGNELNAHIVHKHLDQQCSSCKWDGCKRESVPFNHRQKIIRHIQVHARTTDHMCRICDRPMSSDALLKTHELRHLNEWPFKCKTCGRSFRTKNSLNVHTRTHTGAKPLVCTFPGCGKRFAESSNLAKHKRTHMAPQFMCPACNRMFTRKDHLRRHMRTKDHFDPAESNVEKRDIEQNNNEGQPIISDSKVVPIVVPPASSN